MSTIRVWAVGAKRSRKRAWRRARARLAKGSASAGSGPCAVG
jgi:hypothetical protein